METVVVIMWIFHKDEGFVGGMKNIVEMVYRDGNISSVGKMKKIVIDQSKWW